MDSDSAPSGIDLIKFGIDVLVEKPMNNIPGVDEVVESVELCNYQTLPEDFNSPGYIHPMTGEQVDI